MYQLKFNPLTGTFDMVRREAIQRFEDGVRIIASSPYMEEANEPQRYVFLETGYTWYYDTDTQEIRSRKI